MRSRKTVALAISGFAAVGTLMLPVTAVEAAPLLSGVEVVQNASAQACPDGYFCSYTGADQTGTMYKTAIYWSGTLKGIRSYFNNGSPQEGLDHVQLRWQGDNGGKCIHYWNGAGSDTPYKGTFASAKTITRVEWRGECPD